MGNQPKCAFHPDRPVTTEIEGRVLVCDICAEDDELLEHAKYDWR